MEQAELDDAFEVLQREAAVYARTWWIQPNGPAQAFLDGHPEARPVLNQRLVSNLPTQTADVYAGESKRDWAKARVALHHDVLADLDAADEVMAAAGDDALAEEPDADTEAAPREDASPDLQAQYNAGAVYFVLGLPGSGKTAVLRRLAALHAGGGLSRPAPTASDADEVRVKLPEYAGGIGSGVVQIETVIVTYGELHLAGDGRQDRVLARAGAAVVDVIGDPTHLPRTVKLLSAAGRRCYVLLADCPVPVCQARAKRRAVESGRLVPLTLIEDKDGVPRAALDAALATKLVAGWAVVDTAGPEPRLQDGDGVFDKYLSGRAEEAK